MFVRTVRPRPQQASTPSVAPGFAVQRFIQPRSSQDPVGDEAEREQSEPVPRFGPPRLPPLSPAKLAAGGTGDGVRRQILREPSGADMHSAAAEGARTPAVALPFLDRIQASFGCHPISQTKAHLDAGAVQAARTINARAFTRGDHVVFGGRPDLRTAAHEAAHVVQQRAGVRLPGGIGREGDPYERHADAVADAVVAGRSAAELLEPFGAVPEAGAPVAPAVQRAVGFEFETGWLVASQEQALRWDEAPVAGAQRPAPLSLKKKDLVYAGPGFKVEADEAAEGKSELEFIVHPPVAETFDGKLDLALRMAHMTKLGQNLLVPEKKEFTLDAVTKKDADRKFVIRPNDRTLRAKPQTTAGITLPQVAALGLPQRGKEVSPETGQPQQPKELPQQFGITVRQAASYRASVDDALGKLNPAKVLGRPDAVWSDSLRGFLMLLASYLSQGSQAVFYPKQITDVFLLARTDMATVFRLLPEEEQAAFRENWKLLLMLALSAVDLTEATDLEEPVIGKVWTSEDRTEKKPIGPSRDKWVYFLVNGFDLLSAAHYKEIKAEADNLAPALESMGELGSKTEPVGASNTQGGIFELRGAALARDPIPLSDWFGFTMDVLDYFINLSEVKDS